MIRFSHASNTWQVHIGKAGWMGVSADAARMFWDKGYRLVHFEQLGLNF